MRTIVIGDIHGCHAELMDLLEVVRFSDRDRLIAIGDIVDRGPHSEKVLTFFRDHDNAVSIMGNHERKHIRSARGEIEPALTQRIVANQLGEDYEEWLAFMETFPTCLELPEAILVHGFFEPEVELHAQRDTVLIGTLTGERYLELNHARPWYDHCRPPRPVVVGHHDYLRTGQPLVREGRVYGIDTGCCTGGRLTALVLPGFEIVSVPSRGDHWSAQRKAHASLASSGKSPLDLDWEGLAALAANAGRPQGTSRARARAWQARRVQAECGRLVPLMVSAAEGLAGAIRARLATAADWDRCDEGTRAARFAGQAKGHPAAPLLFASTRGRVDEALVRQVTKNGRKLFSLADALGIEVDSRTTANA